MFISESPEQVNLAALTVVWAMRGMLSSRPQVPSPLRPHWDLNWDTAKLSCAAQNTWSICWSGYQALIHQQCQRTSWYKLIQDLQYFLWHLIQNDRMVLKWWSCSDLTSELQTHRKWPFLVYAFIHQCMVYLFENINFAKGPDIRRARIFLIFHLSSQWWDSCFIHHFQIIRNPKTVCVLCNTLSGDHNTNV